MKVARWLFSLILVGVIAAGQVLAEDEATKATETTEATKAAATAEDVDDEWLNTVWTQVDDMVKEEEFKLQETVTVAAVRGAEAEDAVLDKLYYKGAKRYPSQDKLQKAIDVLRKGIAKNPKGADVPKQKFYIAQCYEKLGKKEQAKDFYAQIADKHSKSSWAAKAEKALTQLAAAK